MKKLLCFLLCLMLTVSGAAVASMTAVAADTPTQYLTITTEGSNPVKVPVGSEVLFFSGVYAGDSPILNGQGSIEYDPDYVSIVSYGPVDNKGKVQMGKYSFPSAIYNSSLVLNLEHPGYLYYNFSKADGICTLDDASAMYSRFRFKAEAPGTTDIKHILRYMMNEDGVKVFNKGVANASVGAYMISRVESATCLTGDVNTDYGVTILDATYIQRIFAGESVSYLNRAADVNGDGSVTLRDALQLRRYLAGLEYTGDIGEWIFPSEE